MPVSAETAARSDNPTTTPILDQHSYRGPGGDAEPPFETVQPTQVPDTSQQAATQPESGTTVSSGDHDPRFKEKVIGYAKEIRGTALRKPETKEQGQRIVHGQESFEPKKVGPKAP